MIRALYNDKPNGQASEWLRVIHRCNEGFDDEAPDRPFGAPNSVGVNEQGLFQESYPECNVIFPLTRTTETGSNIVHFDCLTERLHALVSAAIIAERGEGTPEPEWIYATR